MIEEDKHELDTENNEANAVLNQAKERLTNAQQVNKVAYQGNQNSQKNADRIARLKAKSQCMAGHAYGHWHPDECCPLRGSQAPASRPNGDKKKPHGVSEVSEANPVTASGCLSNITHAVRWCMKATDADADVSRTLSLSSLHVSADERDAGLLVVDTACVRSCGGPATLGITRARFERIFDVDVCRPVSGD